MPHEKFCEVSKAQSELSGIVIFQFIPWNQCSDLDPTVITRELTPNWQAEGLKRDLIQMLASLDLKNNEWCLDTIGIAWIYSFDILKTCNILHEFSPSGRIFY